MGRNMDNRMAGSSRKTMAAKAKTTTPARAPADRGQTITPEDPRIRRFTRMSTDQLVALGVRCLEDQARAKEEYGIICEILEPRFPHQKQEEEIVTVEGVAKRKVTNAYSIDQERIPNMKAILGKEFREFVDEDVEYSVPTDRIAALKDKLGADARRFIKTAVKWKPSPLLTARLRSGADPADRVEGFVEVISTTKVTVKPITA